jgi:hypothetical protein
VTNSDDHAFPGGGKGSIIVSVQSAFGDVDMVTMTISDDGQGFKAKAESKRHGLDLVRRLVEQVRGTATVDSKNGTVWTIKIRRLSAALPVAIIPDPVGIAEEAIRRNCRSAISLAHHAPIRLSPSRVMSEHRKYSWKSRSGVDLVFVSAAASESDAAKLHIRSVAENAGGILGGLCLWLAYGVLKRRLGVHARQFDQHNAPARRAWVKNSRLEVMTSQVPPNIVFKRAGQKNLRQRGRRR